MIPQHLHESDCGLMAHGATVMASNTSQPEKECCLVLDASLIDTTPGAHRLSPFAPPNGWEGDPEAYMVLMRERYSCLDHGQRLGFVGKFARTNAVQCIGPFAEQARRVIDGLARHVPE